MASPSNVLEGDPWQSPELQRADPSLIGDDVLRRLLEGAGEALEHYRAELLVHEEDVKELERICHQRIADKARLAREEIRRKDGEATNYYAIALPAEIERRKAVYLKRLADIGVSVGGGEVRAVQVASQPVPSSLVSPPPTPVSSSTALAPSPPPCSVPCTAPATSEVKYTLFAEVESESGSGGELVSYLKIRGYEYEWLRSVSRSAFVLRMRYAEHARRLVAHGALSLLHSTARLFYYSEDLPADLAKVEVLWARMSRTLPLPLIVSG
jgi:hypothetical protein